MAGVTRMYHVTYRGEPQSRLDAELARAIPGFRTIYHTIDEPHERKLVFVNDWPRDKVIQRAQVVCGKLLGRVS